MSLAEYLTSGVVNFSEEIRVLILVGISVLSQPEAQDEEMSGEKNEKKTDVIDSEHLSRSVGGEGGRGRKDGGEESSGDGGDGLHDIRLGDGREGSPRNTSCGGKRKANVSDKRKT